jgi:hypothetical protein
MYEPDFTPVKPWPLPARDECFFYTCMDLPDGEAIEGANWDIRGRFETYIGGVDVAGKSVLDVGTASGFLAFSAEAAGAARVMAVDALHAQEFHRVPFQGSPYTERRRKWIADTNHYLDGLKRSFWYSWHKRGSAVKAVYMPAVDLWKWHERFDIVIAGAIVEHISDPIPFIHTLARLAKETVVVAFTPVGSSDEQLMRTMNDWDQPNFNYTWWELSIGLYRRVFGNLGFEVELTTAQALCNELDPPRIVEQPTLIARRRP